MAARGNGSCIAEGTAQPERVLFSPKKICMEWQQSQGAGAGIYNFGNTCFLNSVLQCLTYTPPLANYLLSRQHSHHEEEFCMLCLMEAHVSKALRCSARVIVPLPVLRALTRIGPFRPGRQEDAHEFLLCAVSAMQRASLRGSTNLDIRSEEATIIHQIFGGSLRSRVTCWSCKAVSDSFEAFLDVLLDIKAASSVTAALQDFVQPEHLTGFKCSKCDKMVAASKGFTIHQAPGVLMLCLKRFDSFTGRKISEVVEYPEHLDLHPYTSQTAGEPLRYALYAVLVHSGNSCLAGHYFCYIKASNGLWYKMNDSSVEPCDIDTVLRQQAYLLFYVRCSDLNVGERASSSPAATPAPAPAHSCLSQEATGSTQAGAVAAESSPSSHCQRKGARERARSRSPHRGNDLHSWFKDTMEYENSAGQRRTGPLKHDLKNDAVPGSSNGSSQLAPAPRAAREQTLLSVRERSRSPRWGCDHQSWLVDTVDCKNPAGRRRRRTSPPNGDQALRHDLAPGPSNSSSWLSLGPEAAQAKILLRQSKWSRSPRQGYDLRSRFVEHTNHHHSARRQNWRTSPPRSGRAPRDDATRWPSDISLKRAHVTRAAREQTLLSVRERSRSPRRGSDHQSWLVDTMDCDNSAGLRRRRTGPPNHGRRNDAAPGSSKFISQLAPAPRAAREQILLSARERSRSPQRGCDHQSWLEDAMDYRNSAGPRRRRTGPPNGDRAVRQDLAPGPSNSSSLLSPGPKAAQAKFLMRQGKWSRSPRQGYDLRSRFVEHTNHHHSARRQNWRTSPPRSGRAPRDDATRWPSDISLKRAHVTRAAREQTLLSVRERSRSPRRGSDHQSWLVDTMDCNNSAGLRRRTGPPNHGRRNDAAPGSSKFISQLAPAPRAAQEQILLSARERSRSPQRGCDHQSWLEDAMDYRNSAGPRRRRTGPPNGDRAVRQDLAPGPSNSSSSLSPGPKAAQEKILLRQSKWSRSPRPGCYLCSKLMERTDHHRSARRRM